MRTLLAIGLLSATALAHDPGLSASTLRPDASGLRLQLDFHSGDVAAGTATDLDHNGWLDPAEIAHGEPALLAWVQAGAVVLQAGTPLAVRAAHASAGQDRDVRFVLELAPRAGATGPLTLRLDLLQQLARGHRHYTAFLDAAGATRADGLLQTGRNTLTAALAGNDGHSAPPTGSVTARAAAFFGLGVEHILLGYDHVLFLLGLLLAGGTLRALCLWITSFTLAHSVTLGLATLDLVHAPSTVVEAVIAASIVWVGIENVCCRQPRRRWLTTFAFGLVHGFGFASVLRELGIAESGGIAVPLVAFNGGVELGQLAIVAITLPALRWLQRRPALRARVVPALSLLVAAMGAFWLLERTLL